MEKILRNLVDLLELENKKLTKKLVLCFSGPIQISVKAFRSKGQNPAYSFDDLRDKPLSFYSLWPELLSTRHKTVDISQTLKGRH